MKNLSGSAEWFKETENIEKKEEIQDDRVFLSYMEGEVSYMLSSEGKPLVFKDEELAKSYIVKNELVGYVIDPVNEFNFDDIEIIEL